MYYVLSRYYDPEVGRWISSDGQLNDDIFGNNLFAYCSNNPISRVDFGGTFWESIFDVISFGASIVEVCVNPTDPWAWAALVGDALDLIPGITGLGETTKAIKTTVKVVDKADDVIDAAKAIQRSADVASDIKVATGPYEILFESGYTYIGKGGFDRAINSAIRLSKDKMTKPVTILWKSAPDYKSAFIDEFFMQERFGGVFRYNEKLKTYNMIWSPGRRYYYGHK